MDLLLLSRIQFGLTASFHYIYPPMTIGLGLLLVIMEGLYLRTKDPLYERITRFWVKIFGLTFAIGVATGIVLEFEFGTNWATYSRYVGDIFGSALAAEGIFAFFLESGFLAILLFGWNKVSPRMHFFSTVMVCLGAHFSAIWIVVANSWQQTPAGYHIVSEGLTPRAEITDFWSMVLNPSTFDRLSHTIMGAWQAGAFLAISVSAYYLLKARYTEFSHRTIKIALSLALVASVGQLITGHSSAKTVSQYQPAKLAAIEGHYESGPADLYIFGWVDEESGNVSGIRLPGMLSRLLTGNPEAPVRGLNSFQEEDRPPVNATFQFYHLMVVIGMGLIGLSMLGMFFLMRDTLVHQRWLLWLLVFAVLGPQIANQMGWFTAEVGRQPWIVYGLLRTSDGLSQSVQSGMVLTSLILFTAVYLLLFAVFIFQLNHKIKQGPQLLESESVDK